MLNYVSFFILHKFAGVVFGKSDIEKSIISLSKQMTDMLIKQFGFYVDEPEEKQEDSPAVLSEDDNLEQYRNYVPPMKRAHRDSFVSYRERSITNEIIKICEDNGVHVMVCENISFDRGTIQLRLLSNGYGAAFEFDTFEDPGKIMDRLHRCLDKLLDKGYSISNYREII